MADRPPAPGAATIVQLERCSTVIPDDVELLADLAAAYESAGRVDDAQAAYQRVLAIDREYAEVHARLAALLLARGDAATAKMHAELALGLQPNRRAVVELIERASQMEAANR
jgi:Flp pilus assembly protein TadD